MNNKGKERSVVAILILSVITFGLYYFYWYYANINELEGYIDFTDSDTSPKSVKGFLLFYISVSFLISFVRVYTVPKEALTVPVTPDQLMVVISIVSAVLGVILNYKFLKLVDFSFDNMRMEEIGFNGIFSLYAGSSVAGFFSFFTELPVLILVSVALAILYLVVIQGKLNLLWRIV